MPRKGTNMAGKKIDRLLAVSDSDMYAHQPVTTVVVLYDDDSTAILGTFTRVGGLQVDISINVAGDTYRVRAE